MRPTTEFANFDAILTGKAKNECLQVNFVLIFQKYDKMKATLEKINPNLDSSFSIKKYSHKKHVNSPVWHFHPEFEIVYLPLKSKGKRHIGDHISYFNDGDLIFLGPDLPHFGFSERKEAELFELVVQMKEDFLGPLFLEKPEMQAIKRLFEKARLGLSFHGPIKEEVGSRLQNMIKMAPFEKTIELLCILQKMAHSEDYQILNATSFGLEVNPQDHDRIETIYNYVQANFKKPISLEDIAQQISMTVPAFCRFFKKLTGMTFTKFVNEFRIAFARKSLAEEHASIADVCYECGFNNISHFNKTFKEITGESPSDYRKNIRDLIY